MASVFFAKQQKFLNQFFCRLWQLHLCVTIWMTRACSCRVFLGFFFFFVCPYVACNSLLVLVCYIRVQYSAAEIQQNRVLFGNFHSLLVFLAIFCSLLLFGISVPTFFFPTIVSSQFRTVILIPTIPMN